LGTDAGDLQFFPLAGLPIDVRFEGRPAVVLETAIKGELSRLPQDAGVQYFEPAGADIAFKSLRALSGKQGIGLDSNHAIPEMQIVRRIVAIIEAYVEDQFRYLQLIGLASYFSRTVCAAGGQITGDGRLARRTEDGLKQGCDDTF